MHRQDRNIAKSRIYRVLTDIALYLERLPTCYFIDSVIVKHNGEEYLLFAVKHKLPECPGDWNEIIACIEEGAKWS